MSNWSTNDSSYGSVNSTSVIVFKCRGNGIRQTDIRVGSSTKYKFLDLAKMQINRKTPVWYREKSWIILVFKNCSLFVLECYTVAFVNKWSRRLAEPRSYPKMSSCECRPGKWNPFISSKSKHHLKYENKVPPSMVKTDIWLTNSFVFMRHFIAAGNHKNCFKVVLLILLKNTHLFLLLRVTLQVIQSPVLAMPFIAREVNQTTFISYSSVMLCKLIPI